VHEEGRKEGGEKCLEDGLEEGREEWRGEGGEEGLNEGKLQIARSVKLQGVSIDVIIKATGLSKSDIEEL